MYLLVVRKGACRPLHTKPCSTLMQRNGPEYTKQPLGLRSQASQLTWLWQRSLSKTRNAGLLQNCLIDHLCGWVPTCCPTPEGAQATEVIKDTAPGYKSTSWPAGTTCFPPSPPDPEHTTCFQASALSPPPAHLSWRLHPTAAGAGAAFSRGTEPRAKAHSARVAVKGHLRGLLLQLPADHT